ncbi:hypothetical protein C2E23DRAFT_693748, partial [Lenzites betulinus]
LRRSNLAGFQIPGLEERLITTLFADDTTVYLNERDNYHDMEDVLRTWCAASRAKFNEPKTELIPIGSKEYRENLRTTKRLSPEGGRLPEDLKILNEGEPTRMLGAWVGTAIDHGAVWDKTIQTTEKGLERWKRRRPTLAGKRLIINMEVGGRTQYLARVQGMPATVEKKLTKMISDFVWDGTKPRVAKAIMTGDLKEGGIKLLDVQARNEALDLMWLKEYLDISPSRPRWAYVADAIIERAVIATSRRVEANARINCFLQTWEVNASANAGLPSDLGRMIKAARKYGVKVDAPNPKERLKRELPIWYH